MNPFKSPGSAQALFSSLRKIGARFRKPSIQNPPPYEKLVGDLAGAYSRRINIQHRLREAAEQLYKDDLSDLRAAREAWATHSKVADRAVPAREYFSREDG